MTDNNDIKRTVYTPPDSDLLGTVADVTDAVKAYIGPKNTDYYLQKFKDFDNAQGNISWNWPAFFVTWPWLFYRKMWAHGLFYIFGISIAFSLISKLLSLFFGEDIGSGVEALLLLIFAFILYPMYANKIYYSHVNNKIQKSRALGMSEEDVSAEMKAKGGTSRVVLFLVPLLGLIVLGILLAIAIPEYQQYVGSQ